MRYIHKFQDKEELEAVYDGSGYTEPWLSLTTDYEEPSGDIVGFVDEEGYEFTKMGWEENSPGNQFTDITLYACITGTSQITATGESGGVRQIVVDGITLSYNRKLYAKQNGYDGPASEVLYEEWDYYQQGVGTVFTVFTEYGHSGVGDDALVVSTNQERGYDPWKLNFSYDGVAVGDVVYSERENGKYSKIVNIAELLYESYEAKPGGKVHYNKKGAFRILIPPTNSIYYKFSDDIMFYDNITGEYRKPTEAEMLSLFDIDNNFSSSHYDASLGLCVAEFEYPVTEMPDYRNSLSPVVSELYLPHTFQYMGSGGKEFGGLETLVIGSGITEVYSSGFEMVYLRNLYIGSATAPAVESDSFGNLGYATNAMGVRSGVKNILYLPEGATGYNTGYWQSIALNPDICGFNIQYI